MKFAICEEREGECLSDSERMPCNAPSLFAPHLFGITFPQRSCNPWRKIISPLSQEILQPTAAIAKANITRARRGTALHFARINRG